MKDYHFNPDLDISEMVFIYLKLTEEPKKAEIYLLEWAEYIKEETNNVKESLILTICYFIRDKKRKAHYKKLITNTLKNEYR